MELRKLCVRQSLLAYVNRTKVLRAATESDQLFLGYGSDKKGQPITVQRVSSWLKELIKDCYRLMGLPPPGTVRGHQVRKMATTWADLAGVDPELIRQAATWSSNCTFAKHYRLDLIRQKSSDFSRRILEASALSTASFAQSNVAQVSSSRKPTKRWTTESSKHKR